MIDNSLFSSNSIPLLVVVHHQLSLCFVQYRIRHNEKEREKDTTCARIFPGYCCCCVNCSHSSCRIVCNRQKRRRKLFGSKVPTVLRTSKYSTNLVRTTNMWNDDSRIWNLEKIQLPFPFDLPRGIFQTNSNHNGLSKKCSSTTRMPPSVQTNFYNSMYPQ
jgi:hypothetical protein